MRIATIKKASKLRQGERVLVFNAEGEPSWNRVISNDAQYNNVYQTVELEGIREAQEIEAKARVVVWS